MAIACSKPPEGRARWTLQLLSDRLVALTDLDGVSTETVRRRLNELELKPWQKRMWCIKQITPEFIARMEHILELYRQPHDPTRPLVCFDETLKQLVAHVVEPLPASPGQTERIDHHYKRNGIVHLAIMFCPGTCWREVRLLPQRDYRAYVDALASEVAAWTKARNDERATIKWLFRVEHAREKLGRHCPDWRAADEAA